jgi:hypothetical protein
MIHTPPNMPTEGSVIISIEKYNHLKSIAEAYESNKVIVATETNYYSYKFTKSLSSDEAYKQINEVIQSDKKQMLETLARISKFEKSWVYSAYKLFANK